MTANKHTPAPWIVKFRDDGSSYISMGDPLTGPHKQADLFLSVDGGEADLADASLIAAAPELLALLVESQRSIGGDWRERRDAAIAKATGGSA